MPTFAEKLDSIQPESFKGIQIGLEKESLRVNEAGNISQKNHPSALGSALTHPHITTDYAEALLELITPPCSNSADSLSFLADTEAFVYHHLQKEKLWTTSMPCALQGEDDIRIASYGHSNVGQMKTVYRRGLGHRYGKLMQVIAGIHFNFSFSAKIWDELYGFSGKQIDLRDFKDQAYMDMIRNIQRYGWLIIYLFGASPAISQTFLKGVPSQLRKWDKDSYYAPYATSLRMGDMGYTNSKEGKTGICIGYNHLAEYIHSMRRAINTPCLEYDRIDRDKGVSFQQLNANILQIENEHYSTVRPKQVLNGLEKPVDALAERGIQYIELRSLDINPFCPTGITLQQMHFLEIFMAYCLLKESPPVTQREYQELNRNQIRVAQKGRRPGLKLAVQGQTHSLTEHAKIIFAELARVAEKLDQAFQTQRYQAVFVAHQQMLFEPELTPSARILEEMSHHKESFVEFSLRQSCNHREHYKNSSLSAEQYHFFHRLSIQSRQQQMAMEQQDNISFREFLKQYQKGKINHLANLKKELDKQDFKKVLLAL